MVSVWSRWDDRVERATFAAGVGAAIAILVASFLVEPVLAEVLTGWGLAPLVAAVVAIVLRKHRHRDDQACLVGERDVTVAGPEPIAQRPPAFGPDHFRPAPGVRAGA